jgi:hypothetical protein
MNQAAIPLPSDVVEAMAQSISDVRNQMKPRLALLSTQTSFAIGITEGDPRRNVGSIQVRNDGGFGSFLSVTAVPDVPWLTVLSPSSVGVSKGTTATFSFDLVPTSLLATQSPYNGNIVIRDINDPSTAITVSVSVVVIPRPAISVNTQDISMVWSIINQTPVVQNLIVSNSGPGTSFLSVSAVKVSQVSWLSLSPESAGPLTTGQTTTFTLSVVGSAVPFGLGDYTEIIRLSSQNASNSPVDIRVVLTVGP